jgi:hypothetical protein
MLIILAGIQTTPDSRFYAISSEFREFSNRGKTLVLQFSVKHEQVPLTRKPLVVILLTGDCSSLSLPYAFLSPAADQILLFVPACCSWSLFYSSS